VAIAPAVVVPRDLCYDSFNYASKNDLVPIGELLSLYWQACYAGESEREELLMIIAEIQKEIIWLDPHEGATGHDHEFQSPTFRGVIEKHLNDYYEQQGEYR
jgi:hypothetical protein